MRKYLQASLCALTIACGLSNAHAASITVLHAFPGGNNVYQPNGALMQDPVTGNLYGVTHYGSSANGLGDVYELTPPPSGKTKWGYKEIYSFKGSPSDGASPVGALALDHNGNLYGVTSAGGRTTTCSLNAIAGCGTVYELTPNGTTWTEHVLHSFTDKTDGAEPLAGLVLDTSGNLYGTTLSFSLEESVNQGTVFELSPPPTGKAWHLTTLHQFCPNQQPNCRDGIQPTGRLVFDNVGNLYGTANRVIFELSSVPGKVAWKEQILYNQYQAGLNDPLLLDGLVFVNGALYGTSYMGGKNGQGTVFSLKPSGKSSIMTLLHSFGSRDANGPIDPSGLVFDAAGNLYGASNGGGNWGTVFSFNIGTNAEQVIHYFKGGVHDGEFPIDSVIFDKISGNLVGTTQFGGAAHGGFSATGAGTVFELAP